MPVRIMHLVPIPRTAEAGIELERDITISLTTGKASGFYGGITGLPTTLSLSALGGALAIGNSVAYSVQLTAADVEAIVRLILTRSGMPGTVRVDV